MQTKPVKNNLRLQEIHMEIILHQLITIELFLNTVGAYVNTKDKTKL